MVLVNIGIVDSIIVGLMVACVLLMARVFVLSRRARKDAYTIELLEFQLDDVFKTLRNVERNLDKFMYCCAGCGNTELGEVHCYMCESD
jgi:hypothetical protein